MNHTTTHHPVVLKFPLETARCVVCKTTFARKRSERWRCRCITCWRWLKIYELQRQQQRLFAELAND